MHLLALPLHQNTAKKGLKLNFRGQKSPFLSDFFQPETTLLLNTNHNEPTTKHVTVANQKERQKPTNNIKSCKSVRNNNNANSCKHQWLPALRRSRAKKSNTSNSQKICKQLDHFKHCQHCKSLKHSVASLPRRFQKESLGKGLCIFKVFPLAPFRAEGQACQSLPFFSCICISANINELIFKK
jgi:hypothetical protein